MKSHKGMSSAPFCVSIRWTQLERSALRRENTPININVRWIFHHWVWWMICYASLNVVTGLLWWTNTSTIKQTATSWNLVLRSVKSCMWDTQWKNSNPRTCLMINGQKWMWRMCGSKWWLGWWTHHGGEKWREIVVRCNFHWWEEYKKDKNKNL